MSNEIIPRNESTKEKLTFSKQNFFIRMKFPMRIGPYKIEKSIGEGSFSNVCLAYHSELDYYYACKIIPRSKMNVDDFKLFEREVRVNQQIHHPGHVELLDIISDRRNYYLIMQLCTGGSLLDRIIKNGKFTEDDAKPLFKQIIETVRFLHKSGVSHRDLKPENLLFTDDGKLLIADLGLARFVGSKNLVSTPCGSIVYAAPECFSNRPYNGFAFDLWSCGVILFEMVTGHSPWKKGSKSDVIKQIKDAAFEMPSYLSDDCQDLIRGLLQTNPKKRFATKDVLKHRWLKGIPRQFRLSERICGAVTLELIDEFFNKEVKCSSLKNISIKTSPSYTMLDIQKLEKQICVNPNENLSISINSPKLPPRPITSRSPKLFPTQQPIQHSFKNSGRIKNLLRANTYNTRRTIQRTSIHLPPMNEIKSEKINEPPSSPIQIEKVPIKEPPPIIFESNGNEILQKKGISFRIRRKKSSIHIPVQ